MKFRKFFANIYTMWQNTYHTDKRLFWLGAIGTASSIAASIVFNLGLPEPNLWAVIMLYMIGSITLSITSFINKDSWMIMLMWWYTFINIIGIVKLIWFS